MRALTVLVILAFAGWSGWWWVAADQARKGAEAWFAAQASASHAGISVAGYPNRVDLTVTEPALTDAASGFGWQAPFVQVFAMTWKPWHLIAAFPERQAVATPFGLAEVASTRLQASLVLVPGVDLALDRVQVAAEGLALTPPAGLGDVVGAESASFALRQAAGLPLGYDLGLDLRGLSPGAGVAYALATAGLPGRVDRLHLDAVVTLTAVLDRHAGARQPQLAALRLRSAALVYDDMTASATGELVPDARGFAEGRIEVRVTGWRKALAVQVAVGALAPEARAGWESALAALQEADGTLVVPLVLSGGRISFGPFVLGAAPFFGTGLASLRR